MDFVRIITATETLGVEKRVAYYEQSGVLRDMFQNHMLQLLSLCAMEPPARLRPPNWVRDEKTKVLQVSPAPFPVRSTWMITSFWANMDAGRIDATFDRAGIPGRTRRRAGDSA